MRKSWRDTHEMLNLEVSTQLGLDAGVDGLGVGHGGCALKDVWLAERQHYSSTGADGGI